ncbi:hypothetical protein AAG570_008877 [Ranatra chinensis]|uniref:Odorant receptor n=1 Tax=Ranatra chinensis TaxID=642074 RepID=A0ABD0YS57_9HEMI
MASKRRNMFYQNKKQETTEIGLEKKIKPRRTGDMVIDNDKRRFQVSDYRDSMRRLRNTDGCGGAGGPSEKFRGNILNNGNGKGLSEGSRDCGCSPPYLRLGMSSSLGWRTPRDCGNALAASCTIHTLFLPPNGDIQSQKDGKLHVPTSVVYENKKQETTETARKKSDVGERCCPPGGQLPKSVAKFICEASSNKAVVSVPLGLWGAAALTAPSNRKPQMIPFVLGKELKSDPEVVAGYKKTKLFFLRLAGMYPDVSPKGYSIFFFYVNLIYTQFAYYLISYTLALYYSVVWNDMDLMAEDIEFLCFTAFYCYSGTNAIVNRKKLDSLLKYVGRGFYQYHRPQTTEEKEITERSIYRENKVSRFYAAYVSAYLAYFVVFQPVKLVVDTGTITSVLDNASVPVNKMLPLRVWTPYDSSVPFNFVLGSISQVVAACMLMAIMVGVDISFVTLMTQLCNQFKLLNESVKSIYERAAYMFGQEPDKRGTDLFSRPEFQRCMYKCLVENIEHHKVLITFRNELQSFFGLWLLVVFVGSGLTICSSAYLLSTASDQVPLQLIRDFITKSSRVESWKLTPIGPDLPSEPDGAAPLR